MSDRDHPPQLLSANRCAKVVGVSQQTLSRWIKQHPDLNHGTDKRPLMDPDEVRAARSRNRDSYAEAKRRHEAAKANLAELRLKRERGEVVGVEAVVAMAQRAGAVCKEKSFSANRHLAPKLAAETDAAIVRRMLDEATSRVLKAEAEVFQEMARRAERDEQFAA